MDTRIVRLARTLQRIPDNRPMLYLLLQALRSTGQLQIVTLLMECWMSVFQGTRPDLTLLTLYGRRWLAQPLATTFPRRVRAR